MNVRPPTPAWFAWTTLFCVLLVTAGCQRGVPLGRAPQSTASPAPPPAASPAAIGTFPPLRVTAKGNIKMPVVIAAFRPNGSQRYRLEAQSATYDNAHRRASFRDTHVVFYHEGKRLVAQAPAALVDHSSQTVTMDGGVRAVTEDGVVLTCQRLVYYSNTDRVSCDGDVRMVSGNDVLTGGHLDGDLRLEQVTVTP